MKKVITYGTFDMFHYGHQRLLERAKALGDYLIVGVTADGFDMARGKINVQQSLIERIENVRATGLADKIIVEEYEGQKIDDVKRYDVDIFTEGDDWSGKFDYLKEYCEVVYLPRTCGVSSSEIRAGKGELRLGIVGDSVLVNKIFRESRYVNGINSICICTTDPDIIDRDIRDKVRVTDSYSELLGLVDAVYVLVHPKDHYRTIHEALSKKKSVICESPIAVSLDELHDLQHLASISGCVLMDAIKTAYSLAYYHMLLLVKTGKIGDVLSVDAVCTSQAGLRYKNRMNLQKTWNSMCSWGPTAMLPVFQILGSEYKEKTIASHFSSENEEYDLFSKISFVFDNAVASLMIGKGIKSEGELVISGTDGYVYVPAPWWKTDYFEIRYENPSNNRRVFYPLEGEGLRYELLSFLHAIQGKVHNTPFSQELSRAITALIQDYYEHNDVVTL